MAKTSLTVVIPDQQNAAGGKVTKTTAPVATPSGATTYTVKKGDTLNAIAQRFGFKSYKDAGITGYRSGDPNLIFSGETLTIGGIPKSTKAVSPDNASSFINAQQENDMETVASADAPPTRKSRSQKTMEAFTEATGMSSVFGNLGAKPESPQYMKTYNDLRKEYGVKGLEDALTDLEAEEADLVARRRQRVTAEGDKQVAMNVISGRISEVERQEAERLDYIVRQKNTLVSQVQSANATIENIMTFKKMDYDTAKSDYDSQFSQNLQVFNTIKGIIDSDISDEERMADNARANLNIIYGALADGGVSVDGMGSDMKLRVNKLELEAGLPTGFYQNIAGQNPDGKILSTTTRTASGAKYADVLLRQPDGSITVKSIYMGATSEGSGSGSSSDNKQEKQIENFRKDAADYLEKLDKGDISWGAAWNAMRAKYPDASNELIDQMLDKANNY